MKIAILGTGMVGQTLAVALAAKEHEVMIVRVTWLNHWPAQNRTATVCHRSAFGTKITARFA